MALRPGEPLVLEGCVRVQWVSGGQVSVHEIDTLETRSLNLWSHKWTNLDEAARHELTEPATILWGACPE